MRCIFLCARCAMEALSRLALRKKLKHQVEDCQPEYNAGNSQRNFCPAWSCTTWEKHSIVRPIVSCFAVLLAIFQPTFSLGYRERMIGM